MERPMTLRQLLTRGFLPPASKNRVTRAIPRAIDRVVCEMLEKREMLTTFTSPTLPSGHSFFYLEHFGSAGQMRVHEDSPTGVVPIGCQFNNTSGMDIVDLGSLSGITIVDEV